MNKVPSNACETMSGFYVDVVNPDITTINAKDIAWSLSRQARFAGHTNSEEVYNVADHSLFVVRILEAVLNEHATVLFPELVQSFDNWLIKSFGSSSQFMNIPHFRNRLRGHPQLLLAALIHDASEAYLVDLPSPVKRHPALRAPYKELEDRMTQAIDDAFGLPRMSPVFHFAIKWADLIALQIEASFLMPSRGKDWAGDYPQFNPSTDSRLFREPQYWRTAFNEFMNKFDVLYKAVKE